MVVDRTAFIHSLIQCLRGGDKSSETPVSQWKFGQCEEGREKKKKKRRRRQLPVVKGPIGRRLSTSEIDPEETPTHLSGYVCMCVCVCVCVSICHFRIEEKEGDSHTH